MPEFSRSYIQGINALKSGDRRRFNRVLRLADLGNQERNLLLARRQMNRRQWQSALCALGNVTGHEAWVAEALLLRAQCLSFLGEFSSAQRMCVEATDNFLRLADAPRLFGSLVVSARLAASTGFESEVVGFLKQAESFAANPAERKLLSAEWAWLFVRNAESERARHSIENALSARDQLDVFEREALSFGAMDVFVRLGDLERAYRIAEQLKLERGLWRSAELGLYLSWLPFLISGKSRDDSFPRRSGRLYGQSSRAQTFGVLIHALAQGSINKAWQCWSRLATLVPHVYLANTFDFVNPQDWNSLWGRVLLIYLGGTRGNHPSATNSPAVSSRPFNLVDELYQALEKSPHPQSKEELIERLWKVPYDPRLDDRFYKLLERTKHRLAPRYSIVNKNRAYFLSFAT
jgi:hypothetical protein